MSKEEDKGMEIYGQNLFMAAPDPETDSNWIVTGGVPLSNGKAVTYRFRGKEFQARMLAESIGGEYRREGEK